MVQLRPRGEQGQNRLYYFYLMVLTLVLVIGYYVWAIEGFVIYFKHIHEMKADVSLLILARGLTLFCILNAVDISRNLSILLTIFLGHLYCKRRARLRREGRSVWLDDRVRRDPILHDVEMFYRRRDLMSESSRVIKKEFKRVKVSENAPEEERVCPICCENMTEAIKLTCHEKHLFHKECIQTWLVKNRNCPLCKL
jgi:Ring finger domain